jgi:pimeloyl-ACP methyl ester carboxylesterase
VIVPPDSAGSESPDPIVPVPGGPGGTAISAGTGWARILAGARAHRALVLIDPRGTGESEIIDCDFSDTTTGPSRYVHDFAPPDRVRACAALLSRHADLKAYTTEAIAADLAEVLAALNYDRVNLYGVSGGTRQATLFAALYPERVRTLTLGGVLPPEFRVPLSYARDSQRALDMLIDDCTRDDACHAAFPDVRADLQTVLARLDRGPVYVPMRPANGARDSAVLTRGIFTNELRAMLYSPAVASEIPYVLHRAAAGDFEPLVLRIVPALRDAPAPDGVANGHFLSVTCSEDVDRITPAERDSAAAGTFLGDYRVQQQVDACRLWPHAALPPSHFITAPLDVPALLISGDADPVTPPRWAEAERRYLPKSRHVVFPTGGHVPFGNACASRLASAFINAATAEGLDVSCAATLVRPPFRVR